MASASFIKAKFSEKIATFKEKRKKIIEKLPSPESVRSFKSDNAREISAEDESADEDVVIAPRKSENKNPFCRKKHEYDFFTCFDVGSSDHRRKAAKREIAPFASKDGKVRAADYFNSDMSVQRLTKFTIEKYQDRDNSHLFWDGSRADVGHDDSSDGNCNKMAVRRVFVRRLEARLSRDHDARKWLDGNGRLLPMPNPISSMDTMPVMQDSNNPFLTMFTKSVQHHRETILLENIQSAGLPILEIELKDLQFLYHPLFSIEHLLSQKLVALYEEYKAALIQKKQNKYDESLDILRKASANVVHKMLEEEGNANIYKNSSIRKNYSKIADVRKRRIEEGKHIRMLIKNMLMLWKDVKAFRNRNGAVSTPLAMEIKKKAVNKEEDERIWEEQFKLEILDAIAELECEYIEQKLEYKSNLRLYKSGAGEKPLRPSLEYDEDEVKERISKDMFEAFRSPGDPDLEISVRYASEIITRIVKTSNEIARRTKVANAKIFARILLDEIEICRTNDFGISDTFFCLINENFSINVEPKNQALTLEFTDNSGTICSMDLTFPTDLINDSQIDTLLISGRSNDMQTFEDIILNQSDIPLSSTDLFYDNVRISAMLRYKIGWSEPPSLKIEKNKFINEEDYIKSRIQNQISYNYIDINLTKIWIEKYIPHTYTNKPKILSMINEYEQLENNKMTPFAIDDGFNINKEHLKNARFKLLLQRNESDDAKSRLRMIPLLSSEISIDMVDSFDEKLSILYEYSNFSSMMNPVDLQRRCGVKYLEHINRYILLKNKQRSCGKQMKDIIIGYHIPDLRTLFSSEFLRQKRPLCPERKGMDAMMHTCFPSTKDHHLIVSIVRAFHLPSRIEQSANIHNRGDMGSSAAFRMVNMHPYVRVTCQGKSERTSTASGLSPTWNQQLMIPIKNELSSEIVVSLYDEIREELPLNTEMEATSSRAASLVHHYRLTGRWLAELRIPFSTVAKVAKIDGTFKMRSPPAILGYEYASERNADRSSNLPFFEKEDIFLTVYVAIQPPLPNDGSSLAAESGKTELGDERPKNFRASPRDAADATFVDTSGETKAMSGFFRPLPTPEMDTGEKEKRAERLGSGSSEGAEEASGPRRPTVESLELRSLGGYRACATERQMQACAKYVALIPTYRRKNDIVTLMGTELLKLICGSELDHAILLACYFLELGVKCWLAVGFGRPNGASAYVLFRTNTYTNRLSTIDDNSKTVLSGTFLGRLGKEIWNYHIFDISTGIKYDVKDPFCPLQKVYYVCNNENVWVNIQIAERCDITRFDFEKLSDWQPLFEKNFLLTTGVPVEINRNVIYKVAANVDSMRSKIEDRIRTKIQKWRTHHKTNWNRYCSTVLRESLREWEYWTFNPSLIKPEPSQRLLQMLSSYKMYGFPLNMPYVNSKAILSAVKATGIHSNECTGTEFALAVELFPYPNTVISVWVFIATLMKK